MKKCNNCKIYIGGSASQCPICQGGLVGEDSSYNWPPMKKLRLQSFFYKLQLFIVLALTVVSLALDVLLELNTGKHWSFIVAIWAISGELLLRHFLKKSVVVAAIITESSIHIMLLLILTGWYLGFRVLITNTVAPIVVSVLLIVNLILSLIDKYSNALVYLLINIMIAIVPYLILYIKKSVIPLAWTICLMISVVTFIGICIFRGRNVLNEVQKRMSI